MKKNPIKISASEINRFIYCPYQWYYNRIYGQKTLSEKKANVTVKKVLPKESNFKRGLRFHETYYKSYQIKKRVEYLIILILIILLIWWGISWNR